MALLHEASFSRPELTLKLRFQFLILIPVAQSKFNTGLIKPKFQ